MAHDVARVAGDDAVVDDVGVEAGAVSGGRVSLEERLNSVLHEARTNGSTECPLCHARVRPAAAGAATPASAECDGCGSRLS